MIIPYFTDSHISGTNSENRIGDYYSDSMAKLEEILQIAKKNDSPFILCGGDLIDSFLISLVICDDIIDLVEKYNIPVYTLVGNHPMLNHNWEVSKATTLAHIFRRTDLIIKLDNLEGKDYLIDSIDYAKDIESTIRLSQLKLKKSTKKWTVCIVHAFLTPKPFLPNVNHIPVQELDSDYDLVLCGHYHHPFVKIINETIYVNPGCVGRTAIDEANIEPSVVLLDTNLRQYKIIKLKSAKKAEEIFDLVKIEKSKQFESSIEEFIQSLQTTQFSDLDLIGIAKQVCKKSKVSKEIEEEILNRITIKESK